MFFDPDENKIDLKGVYEDSAGNYIPSEKGFERIFYWSRQVQRIERILGRETQSVLDIGCRTGDFLLHFPGTVIRDGVELTSDSVSFAKKRGLSVYCDFVEDIDFESQYDVVTCYALIEHLVNPNVVLEKISSLVKPGGVLVLMIPTFECVKRWLLDKMSSHEWWMYSPPQHLNYFSRKYLDFFINERGFSLVDHYYTSGGMFNPFSGIPLASKGFGLLIDRLQEYTPINKLPVFDHMYLYYKKNP